jgi:hypothetical protein
LIGISQSGGLNVAKPIYEAGKEVIASGTQGNENEKELIMIRGETGKVPHQNDLKMI